MAIINKPKGTFLFDNEVEKIFDCLREDDVFIIELKKNNKKLYNQVYQRLKQYVNINTQLISMIGEKTTKEFLVVREIVEHNGKVIEVDFIKKQVKKAA